MPHFDFLKDSDVLPDSSWAQVSSYRSDELYDENKKKVQGDYQGRKYQLIKFTRQTPIAHKIGYIFLTIFTLGLCLIFKPIRNALFNGIETKRFGISLEHKSTLSLVLACPSEFQPYFILAPKKFVNKIFASNLYDSAEKEKLFSLAKYVYNDNGKPIQPKSWVWSNTTKDYLDALTNKHPQFRTLPIVDPQIEDKDFNKTQIDEILAGLPKDLSNLSKQPYIFGHAFRVNGNHRTAFIIDLANRTVEYYNSFGSDSSARSPLTQLSDALGKKYQKQFVYRHVTDGIFLQSDAYQCGIWTCKFIEERIKEGINFNPRSCQDCKIDQYRTKVFNKVFKYGFYNQIGQARLHEHLEQFLPAYSPAENSKFIAPSKRAIFSRKQVAYKKKLFFNVSAEYLKWCKTGEIPVSLLHAIGEIQKEN